MTSERAAKKAGAINTSKPAPQRPRTLMEAHLALARIRPCVKAPLEQWQEHYQKSVALYAEIAETDRGHHHETLYWVEREKRKAKEVTDAITNGTTTWNPFS